MELFYLAETETKIENQPSLNLRFPHLKMIASLLSREGAHTGRGCSSAASFGAKFKQRKARCVAA